MQMELYTLLAQSAYIQQNYDGVSIYNIHMYCTTIIMSHLYNYTYNYTVHVVHVYMYMYVHTCMDVHVFNVFYQVSLCCAEALKLNPANSNNRL